MAENWLSREALLIGEEALSLLQKARVAVIGLGGVGGACAEGLCRTGIGSLILMDHDTVDETNLNRQLFATRETLGLEKTEAADMRLRSINPKCERILLTEFYSAETSDLLFSLRPDYIVDCIDTVTAKLHLAARAEREGIPLLMSLGTGNRLDPTAFRIGDIEETAHNGAGDGLARVMRRETKKRGIGHFDVLFSDEPASKAVIPDEEKGRYAPGSISFCPPAAGFIEAGFVVRKLIGKNTGR